MKVNPPRCYSRGMALAPEELERRIKAARELRGLDQDDLGRLFKADGLGLHDPGRIERANGKDRLDMQRVHLQAFMRHLRMPEWWFTASEIRLTEEPPADLSQRLDEIGEQIDVIRFAVDVSAAAQDSGQPPDEESGTARTSGS